jgi:histone deacetylase complex regulatory component SIN3
MKMFSLYVEGICGADELFAIMEDVFRHIDEFEQFKSFCLSRECNRRKYTWFCRNPDDINMKDCTRIDHSYTTIPDDFPQSVYTGQKGTFCQQVLNHIVVSVPQGSESSFTFKAKNKHEESLFKIEDERYEIDQAINLNNDVIQVLEKANEQLKDYEGEYELDPKLFTKARVSWIYQM